MAITTTSIGTNSIAISYSSEDVANILPIIKTQMNTLGGWTHITDSGNYSYFRNPQKDGPTSTYLKGLRLFLTNTLINVHPYEKMDTVVDTVTTQLHGNSSNQSVDFVNGGTLYMICDAQRIIFFSEEDIAGRMGWCGAWEVSRDHGIPVGPQSPYQWSGTSSNDWHTREQCYTSVIDNSDTISTSHNNQYFQVITDFGSYGQPWSTSTSYSNDVNHLATGRDVVTGKHNVSSMRHKLMHTQERSHGEERMMGRVYGMSIIAGKIDGDVYEVVQVPTDADGFASATGTGKDHVILANGGTEARGWTLVAQL